MAIARKTTKKAVAPVEMPVQEAVQTPVAKPAQRRTYGKGLTDAQKRERLITTKMHPTAVDFLKENFGIDVNNPRLPLSSLYDIVESRVTPPLAYTVTPLVYDRASKKVVEGQPLDCVGSLRFIFPYDKDYKPIAIDESHRVYVSSYPCHEYLQKADISEVAERSEPSPKGQEPDGELPRFNTAQVQALEGIGIKEDRLYSDGFNALPVSVKRDILAGEVFDVNGTVRTSFGSVNVTGRAKMVTLADGTVKTKFDPRYPVPVRQDSVLDILNVRRIGSLELDFFERDARGKVKKDIYDIPIINKAGRDLVKYGVTMDPVYGYLHMKEFDKKENKFVDVPTKARYHAAVVNGGIYASRDRQVPDLNEDGTQRTVVIAGKEQDKFHYEVSDVRVNKDGTVRVGSDDLKFASAEDLKNYRAGIGGVVIGAKWHDFKDNTDVVYNAWAVPDITKNGFAKVFSPETSKTIKESHERKVVESKKKKQNFSMGF